MIIGILIAVALIVFYYVIKYNKVNLLAATICGVVGFFLGSKIGIASGGIAINFGIVLALLAFIIGGFVFKKNS